MAVFYIFYRLFLIKDTWHRLNRTMLLATAVLSFILPLCIITIHKTQVIPMPMARLIEAVSNTPVQSATPWWHTALMTLYAAGVAFVLARVLTSVLRVRGIIRRARKEVMPDGTVVYIMPGNAASFSWMGHIVISEADWNNNETAIISHEKAHVALHHSIDVLITDLITAVQWFNPAIWMLRIDLRAVHEYEADDTVLRAGTDLRSYQYLLISKAAAMNGYTIANNFNHSILKNRIFMMEKERTTRKSLLRALYLFPLVCISLALNAKTKVDYVYDNDGAAQAPEAITAKIIDDEEGMNVQWNVENYQPQEGIDDMIYKLPGVQKDENGNITVYGKPVSKVLFDGKVVYNTKDADVEDHTIHMKYSGNSQEYISYTDTIDGVNADGGKTRLIERGMIKNDASVMRLTGDNNINMNISMPDNMSIEDMVKMLPGAEIDDDGNITVNGKKISKVLVNGEEVTR